MLYALAFLISVPLGAAIGGVFTAAGYGPDTMMYWLCAVPSSFLVGVGAISVAAWNH
jgi:hypothetical protein